ncbi:hypothetical protein, partial [Streptomyces sp. NPDC056105]|uniref:hypothetical protein n=1 Tax=Streptomyces sp. NPDC056105 TaxID=3345714 RepID=UPI0035E10965
MGESHAGDVLREDRRVLPGVSVRAQAEPHGGVVVGSAVALGTGLVHGGEEGGVDADVGSDQLRHRASVPLEEAAAAGISGAGGRTGIATGRVSGRRRG